MTREEDIRNAVETMKRGGIILYPTDTVWGIGCDATNPEAVKRVYDIKQRDDSKALICLVDSDARLQRYIRNVPDVAWQLIDSVTLGSGYFVTSATWLPTSSPRMVVSVFASPTSPFPRNSAIVSRRPSFLPLQTSVVNLRPRIIAISIPVSWKPSTMSAGLVVRNTNPTPPPVLSN